MLVSKPTFLILDEPTNHLDEESMRWLETWLSAYEGTVLFVSHDRTFIDRVATSVIEFSAEKLTKYKGGYTDYKGYKERELKEQETIYRKRDWNVKHWRRPFVITSSGSIKLITRQEAKK